MATGMNEYDLTLGMQTQIDPLETGVVRLGNLHLQGNLQLNDSRTLAFGNDGTTDSYIKWSGTNLTFYDSVVGVAKTLSQLVTASGISTIDEAFDGGKIIDGATSAANALQVGGTNDKILIYENANNDVQIGTTAGATLTITAGSGAIGFGDENLTTTGKVTADGGIEIGADSIKATWGASDATDSYIMFNGTSMVFFDSDYGAEVTLKTLTNNAMVNPVIAGDATITDGKLTWTDAADEIAGAFTFANVANNSINLTANSITTGTILNIASTSLAGGSGVKVTAAEAALTGKYFEAYDTTAGATVFAVKADGEIEITGTAAQDMLTITAGNVQVDNGKVEVDTTQDIQTYFKRNNATGTAAVVQIQEVHATGGTTLLVNSDATDGNDALQVTHDGTGYGLSVIGTAAGGKQALFQGPASQTASIVVVDGTTGAWIGANGVGMVHASSDGALAHAGASLLYSTYTGNTAAVVPNGACAYFLENGTVAAGGYTVGVLATTANGLKVGTSAAATTSLLVTGGVTAGETSSMVLLNGTAGNGFVGAAGVGMLHLSNDKVLANATASLLYSTYTGNAGGANIAGACANLVEGGAASGTSYALGVSSTNNNGVNITTAATGKTALTASCAANATASIVAIDGTTNDWIGAPTTGMVSLTSDGAVVADASLLRIASSGQPAAANDGVCLELVESGAAQATSYVMRIASTNNEALHVDSGTVLIDETLKATGGLLTIVSVDDVADPPTAANMATAFGAPSAATNGMIGVINDADAGLNVWLCVGANEAWYYAAKLTAGA